MLEGSVQPGSAGQSCSHTWPGLASFPHPNVSKELGCPTIWADAQKMCTQKKSALEMCCVQPDTTVQPRLWTLAERRA